MKPWEPAWELPPAPEGEDEPQVEALYLREKPPGSHETWLPWPELPEWIRESWRREYRNA
jgi:hypothetical protein